MILANLLSAYDAILMITNLAFLTLRQILPRKPNNININFSSASEKYEKNILPETAFTFGVLQNKNILNLNVLFLVNA
jgi:hypothetical protein